MMHTDSQSCFDPDSQPYFDFKARFGRVDDVPAAGFLLMKCARLDEINVNLALVESQLWDIDWDFLELADALVVVPTGVVE